MNLLDSSTPHNLHVAWANEHHDSRSWSSASTSFAGNAAGINDSVGLSDNNNDNNNTSMSQPPEMSRLRACTRIKQPLLMSPGNAYLIAGNESGDVELPPQPCPGEGSEPSGKRKADTAENMAAPVHASSPGLLPSDHFPDDCIILRTCRNRSPKDRSSLAITLYQGERQIVEAHLDMCDQTERASPLDSSCASPSCLVLSSFPEMKSGANASQPRERRASLLSVASTSSSCPSSCTSTTYAVDGSVSPEPLAMLRVRRHGARATTLTKRHSSTATCQPRARCGCRGISVQVNT